MRDGRSSWPVFLVPVLALLLLTLVRASSQVGSSLAAAAPLAGSECFQNDTCTLLAFKKRLLGEGEPALVSWRNMNVSQWIGVTWQEAADGVPTVVEKLELGGLELNGTNITPLLQQGLTNLIILNISNNFLEAQLPSILRICPALQVLDLHNNSFFGPLPQGFECRVASVNADSPLSLQTFDLGYNNFSGDVPNSLFSGQTGGGLTNLSSLVLEFNKLSGSFPPSIGSCVGLVELKLSNNNFSGQLPFSDLGNLTNLEILEAKSNSISGTLQIPTAGGSFGRLRHLILGDNFMSGHIPENLGNLSNLEILELKYNNLTETIPRSLGNLAKLGTLSLQQNMLKGSIPVEFSQLSMLTSLSLNHNKLHGNIWPQLHNCTQLNSIWLSQNSLNGTIPPELGNLTNLVVVSLYGNYFSNSIPAELGRLKNLVVFDLSWMTLTGEIPVQLCNLTQLQVLFLNNNQLTGSIPGCFGQYYFLRLLDVSFNQLTGNLPTDVGNLSSMAAKSSEPPRELSSATYIQELAGQNLVYTFSQSPISYFFYSNFLSGPIPPTFGQAIKMQQLSVRNNSLSGPIPGALGDASALYSLDLSHNDLNGSIPLSLTKLSFLSSLNLSFNDLSGPIPEASQFLTFTKASYLGNPKLCGIILDTECTSPLSPSGAPGGSSRRPIGKRLLPMYIILASALVCVCFLGGLFSWSWIRGCRRRNSSLVSNDGEMCESKDDLQFFHVTISSALPSLHPGELALATENYNENNIIGDGGFGLVYRAQLTNGSVVAVKKLIEDGTQGQSEFLAEMRTLGKIKHRNLVSLLGYCAYGKERILVYEYMKNGCLDTWLHCREEGMASLDWRTRLKVARGAAEGLAFLHHGLIRSIIHRDIKASNILLDTDFEARLADFGLARSTRAYESHVSTDFAGTAGYIPPEYSQATAATTKGDVYSFGVVLLEILTGRRPTDPFFKKKEMSHVVTWILDISMEEAIEKTLDMSSAASTDEMLELMRIASLCCHETASRRPNMRQVVQMLEALERQQSPSRSPSVVLYDEAMSSPRCR